MRHTGILIVLGLLLAAGSCGKKPSDLAGSKQPETGPNTEKVADAAKNPPDASVSGAVSSTATQPAVVANPAQSASPSASPERVVTHGALGRVLGVPIKNTYLSSLQFGVPPVEVEPSRGSQYFLICPVVRFGGPKKVNEFVLRGDAKQSWTPSGFAVASTGRVGGIPGIDDITYFARTDVVATGENAPLPLVFEVPRDLPKRMTLQFRTETVEVEVVTMDKWKVLRKSLSEGDAP